MNSNGSETAFKTSGRIVIVGASLAGLRAAETLRAEGFTGPLTVIGDEPYVSIHLMGAEQYGKK